MIDNEFLNPIDKVLFSEFEKKLPSNMTAVYEGYGPKGFFSVYRNTIFFSEIAHIITNCGNKIDPHFRWYVGEKTRKMIQKIIDDCKQTFTTM